MNKKNMKEIFAIKINRDDIYNAVLCKSKERWSGFKILQYGVLSLCCLFGFLFFTGRGFSANLEDLDSFHSVKIFAYEDSQKVELAENVTLKLERYNPAMSMVPGYPIFFEVGEGVDSIRIGVENGSIFKFDGDLGTIDLLDNQFVITESEMFCFQVQKNTVVSVLGFLNGEEVGKKQIFFSSDDDFNYYATVR